MNYSKKIGEEVRHLEKVNDFPSREQLDQAFHYLQDQITRISVNEEEEMVKIEKFDSFKQG
jgi:hypothetical protein